MINPLIGRHFYFIIFLLIACELPGQKMTTEAMKLSTLASQLSRDSVEKHLTILSADDMEGREAGHPGNLRAARYLADKLASYGFHTPPRTRGYFQQFPLYKQTLKNTGLEIGQHTFEFLYDFYALPSQNPNLPSFQANEIIYLGYGLVDGPDKDFGNIDLTNKVVMIEEGFPPGVEGKPSRGEGLSSEKIEAARKAGVRVILVKSDKFSERSGRYRGILKDPSIITELSHAQGANVIYISPRVAARIMKGQEDKVEQYRSKYSQGTGRASSISAKSQGSVSEKTPVSIRKPFHLTMHKVTEYEYIPNVVGYLPGKDPELSHEVLVLSAHLDHLGVHGEDIYNGADDDGSGVSAILEIGRVISNLSKSEADYPKRSLLILFANAEEKGLLGSAYYADHPLFLLENTITNLNVDMIGRRDEHHQDNPYYVYIIGSDKLSSDLHETNETVNELMTNLELDYRYNDEADPNRFYYRSDHYNFAKNNIPVIFYFTGVHEDYHQPTDTIEKIEFAKMMTITKLIFGTAWELLNNESRPVVDQ